MAYVSQIDLIGAILKHLDKRQGVKTVSPRQYNKLIEAANMIVEVFEIDNIPARPGMTLDEWRKCDDTGMSSRFVAFAISGSGGCDYAHPYDAADFSRVYKLLKFVDGMDGKISALRQTGAVWQRLVDAWEELTALYEAGNFDELNKRISAAIKG